MSRRWAAMVLAAISLCCCSPAAAEKVMLSVLTPDGKPAVGAELHVGDMSSPLFPMEPQKHRDPPKNPRTGNEGQVSFERTAEADRTALAITHDSGYAWLGFADLPADRKVKLRRWGAVRGVVKVKDKPIANKTVTFDTREHRVPMGTIHFGGTAKTDARGEFRLDKVPAGLIAVLWNRQDDEFREVIRCVVVEPGKTATLDLGGSGTRVTGRIVPGDGLTKLNTNAPDETQAAGRLAIRDDRLLTPPSGDAEKSHDEKEAQRLAWYLEPKQQQSVARVIHLKFRPKPDGTFHLDDVPPGTYELRVSFFRDLKGVAELKKEVFVAEDAGDELDLGELPAAVEGL